MFAGVSISVDGIDSNGHWQHVNVAPQHLLGHVVRGTGYVRLGALDGLRGGKQAIPVFETDFGRAHGRNAIHGRTLPTSGHTFDLAVDAGTGDSPASAVQEEISMDGALVYAAVPEWKRTDGAWELRRLTMNEFRNGVLTRRAVATFDVKHEQARLGLVRGTAEATLGCRAFSASHPSRCSRHDTATNPLGHRSPTQRRMVVRPSLDGSLRQRWALAPSAPLLTV